MNAVAGKSYAVEFTIGEDTEFTADSMRFASHEEADECARAMKTGATIAHETRIVESEDAVNHAWKNGELVIIDGLDNETRAERTQVFAKAFSQALHETSDVVAAEEIGNKAVEDFDREHPRT